MTAEPKPRRFAFTLRSLFVVVTLIATVVGGVTYHLNWIQQRHDHLAAQSTLVAEYPMNRNTAYDFPTPVNAPGLLRLIGERGEPALELIIRGDCPSPADELRKAQRLFPDAQFRCILRTRDGLALEIYP
jgi:hypothetical protein